MYYHYRATKIAVEKFDHESLMQQLEDGSIDYLISSHIPAGEDLWAAPLAEDGLAFVVNKTNPLADLSIDDLRDIFSGHIVDWVELGGLALQITPLTVSASSDTFLEIKRMLTGATGITGNARLVPGFGAMLNTVAEEPGAIGYAPLALVDDSVKTLAVDGISPSSNNISKQLYPLRSTIYVIGREEPPPSYRNLFGWIQSAAGQAVVAESHVPLP